MTTTTVIDPNKMLTLRELAARLGVSGATAARLRAAGKLPAPIRVGNRLVRWHPAELDAWILAGAPALKQWEAMRKARPAGQPRPRAQYVGTSPVC